MTSGDNLSHPPRPPITLVTRQPSWLGGGAYMRQLIETVQTGGLPGDRVATVGSLRGGSANLRLPSGVLKRIGARGGRTLGRALWRDSCVHRVNVDLPPARHEVLTIMDLAPLHFDDEGPAPSHIAEQVRRARGVVALTQVIADEVTADMGAQRVWLVPPRVDDRFFVPVAPDGGAEGRAPYVLHVGGATQRKGLGRLAEAWPQVRALEPDLELVMTGPEHPVGRTGLLGAPGVQWRGLAEDDEVLALMRGARALVVPSTYEGFGIPVAEALALGTPVVVLSGAATQEVGGDAAFVAEAGGGADALAEQVVLAIRARDSDPDRLERGQALARRFAGPAVAALQLAAYQEAFG